jgi:hypothetical protein
MVQLSISSHENLKKLAKEHGCTMAQFIDDSVAKAAASDITTGNLWAKLDRIENHLKQLDADYHEIYEALVKISNADTAKGPLVPYHRKETNYKTDKDLKTESEHLDDLRKLSDEDEAARREAIARGEDVPERPRRKSK